MSAEVLLAVALLFALAALLYSAVGHGGASAYLAIMALAGIEPLVMRPTALVLNILVGSIAALRFHRAGQLELRALAPLLLGSIPLAFLGGTVILPATTYKLLVGAVLLVAAVRLWLTAATADDDRPTAVPPWAAIPLGGGLGLLAGLTGTGGAIFMTPAVLLLGWASPRRAAGLSAGFVVANSVAGLAGNFAVVGQLPPYLALWLPAVLVGALIGTELGVRRLSPVGLRRALALVLVVAGLKLILVG
ncbi:MAG TPA: sulfite exporter TauE/SafE family protein [Candidatus Limnocylindrales bacterium]|nr:sulfite exporter TauE/SafE family protein [Candidatus Limnocylindrales bacterium]